MQEQKITAVAFLHKDWKLFVAKRADTKQFLPWIYELPWWHIEFGETLEDWLRREINEEFHIDAIIGEPFYAFTYTGYNNTRHTVQLVYFATMKGEHQEIQLNEHDHSEYRWISEDEVQEVFGWHNEEEGKAAMKWFKILKEKK